MGVNSIAAILRREIESRGPVSFARFMELALYHPEHGYYERAERPVGRRGDFHTSVSVGPLFGELLASQFARWLAELGPRNTGREPPRLVEAGAHDGRLAADVLGELERRGGLRSKPLTYTIVEPSARRQEWQRATLRRFASVTEWRQGWESFEDRSITGIIFANELLDAMPAHRLAWDAAARRWFEWSVGAHGSGFAWRARELPLKELEGGQAARRPRQEHSDGEPAQETVVERAASKAGCQSAFPPAWDALLPESLLVAAESGALPDGFCAEVSPAAVAWWKQAADKLAAGCLVTFDYGLEDAEFLDPSRSQGTLRGYKSHHITPDLLADPGSQDITAHVNFTALRRAGEEAGLETAGLFSQEQFLMETLREAGWAGGGEFSWDAKRLRQLKTLTHPDQMGRKFRVLAQRRPT